jgi:adenosylhomocysteine nucleosidase
LSNIKKDYSHVGILSAMPEEVGVILDNLKSVRSSKFGDLELFSGVFNLNDKREVFITTGWSGWGKVSAARATTRLISSSFNSIPVEMAIFTGVAGAADKELKKWDIILSNSVMQHDMDARPLFDKFVVPAIKNKKITPNYDLLEHIYNNLGKELNKKKNFFIWKCL